MATIGELSNAIELAILRGAAEPSGPPVLIASPGTEEVLIARGGRMPWRTVTVEPPRRSWRVKLLPWSRKKASIAPMPPVAAARPERLSQLMKVVNQESVVLEIKKAPVNEAQYVCVGRARRNDIVVEDHTISTLHAQLEITSVGVRLMDCRSSNGTYVNHRKLNPYEAVTLESGDCVRFGGRVFYFLEGDRLRQLLKFRLAKRLAGIDSAAEPYKAGPTILN